jgi:hypothetical protein
MRREDFWEWVDRSGGPDACWPWLLGCVGAGYGSLKIDGFDVRASRLAWALTHGDPGGMHVLHECDVRYPPGDISYRRCCNPAHLKLGTNADNHRDKAKRGRAARGTRNAHAKLTEAQVRELRAAWDAGERPGVIASRLGVSRPQVYAVGQRKHWAWLPETPS